MANNFIGGKFQAVGADGLAIAGAKLYTYAAGTLTPQATYTSQSGGATNSNPVVCDAAGQASVWLGTLTYRMILKTASDVVVWDVDNISSPTAIADLASTASASFGAGMIGFLYSLVYGAGTVGRWLKDLALAAGSTFVGWAHAGTGAVTRTISEKIRETRVSVFDYGALGDNSQDDTAKQQAAITYAQSTYDPAVYASNSPAGGPGALFYPPGYYKTTDVLQLTKKVAVQGEGPAEFSSGSRVVQTTTNKDLFKVTPIAQGCSVSFEDLTVLSNTGGTGSLIHVVRGGSGSTCNSQRYRNLVFGTPQAQALNIEAGDDIMARDCLVDVSATNAVSLGTATAADAVSNATFSGWRFYSVATRCFLLYNVQGLQISAPSVYPNGAGRTTYFIDGYNSLPYQIKNVSVHGGVLKNVDCIAKLTSVNGFSMVGLVGESIGAGAGATLSGVELTGAGNTNVTIADCTLSCSFDTKHVYDDSNATGGVAAVNIQGNTFINSGGGAGQALVCGNSTGIIANNSFIGFTTPSVSQKVTTTGGAINTGAIASGATYTSGAFTVTGARAGDKVIVGYSGTTFPLAAGLDIEGLVTANDTVKFVVRNGTAGSLTPAAFDITYTVVRGV